MSAHIKLASASFAFHLFGSVQSIPSPEGGMIRAIDPIITCLPNWFATYCAFRHFFRLVHQIPVRAKAVEMLHAVYPLSAFWYAVHKIKDET